MRRAQGLRQRGNPLQQLLVFNNGPLVRRAHSFFGEFSFGYVAGDSLDAGGLTVLDY